MIVGNISEKKLETITWYYIYINNLDSFILL